MLIEYHTDIMYCYLEARTSQMHLFDSISWISGTRGWDEQRHEYAEEWTTKYLKNGRSFRFDCISILCELIFEFSLFGSFHHFLSFHFKLYIIFISITFYCIFSMHTDLFTIFLLVWHVWFVSKFVWICKGIGILWWFMLFSDNLHWFFY